MGTVSTNSNVDSIREATQLKSAMDIASMGWPVLPLYSPTAQGCSCANKECSSPGKHPITKRGLKDATADLVAVREWWTMHPHANLGILTGKDSGIVVLDIDPRHGGDRSLEDLQREFARLPPTLKVKTGGGGEHYYFSHPGGHIGNRASIREGVDFRGDGGYVVAPPSIHCSQQPYAWEKPQQDIAELPPWLSELIQSRSSRPIAGATASVPTGFTETFLNEGNRHNSLLSIAGFLKHKGLSGRRLLQVLSAINAGVCEAPLGTDEVQKLAQSVDCYEEQPWPDRQDLAAPPTAPTMNPEMLPSILRPWCLDIAERMQVPLEFVAGTAVVMLAGAIGRRVAIHPRQFDDWQVIPNLWGMLIAPPGSLKSPAMSAVLKPLNNLAYKARSQYLDDLKAREKDEVIAKAEMEALKEALKSAIKNGRKDKSEECKNEFHRALKELEEKPRAQERRYLANDPTIEKLLLILEENPQGLLLYRDELSGWIETMHKSGREGDREFFLEAWNGDSPYSMDRVGRGSTFVEALCLSVMGGLQPGKFSSYVSAITKVGKSDDGLLQRFQILIFPERRKHWKKVDRKPDGEAAKRIEGLLDDLDKLPLPQRVGNEVQRARLHFSDEAQVVADEWFESLENRLCCQELSPIFEAHLSKYRSLMPSLALIFALVEAFDSGRGLPDSVGTGAVQLAAAWCTFLEAHARKAYGEHLDPEEAAGRRLLAKLKEGAIKDYDRCRDIYRRGWKGLTTAEDFDIAVKALQNRGWLRTEVITPPNGGRSEVIRLHPSLRFNAPPN